MPRQTNRCPIAAPVNLLVEAKSQVFPSGIEYSMDMRRYHSELSEHAHAHAEQLH